MMRRPTGKLFRQSLLGEIGETVRRLGYQAAGFVITPLASVSVGGN